MYATSQQLTLHKIRNQGQCKISIAEKNVVEEAVLLKLGLMYYKHDQEDWEHSQHYHNARITPVLVV